MQGFGSKFCKKNKDIEANRKLNRIRNGFTNIRSFHTNLIAFFDKLIFLDKGNSIALIYLDFGTAFDMVLCRKLLVKIEKLDIRTRLVN